MGLLDEEGVFGCSQKNAATASHEIGAPLDRLSIDEIGQRIHLLQAEIDRLETARSAKESTRRAADSFFKG